MTSVVDVQDLAPRAQYTATGAQTVFPYPFPIFEDGDLVVYDESTLQVITTDYTVSGAGDDTGGDVTFTSGRTAGHVITIYRDIEIERRTDFQQNGPRSSSTMNDELDRITMVEQQLESLIARTVKMSPLDTSDDDNLVLPLVPSRAGKFFAFDVDGAPSMSEGTGNDSALRTDLAKTVVASDGARLVGYRRTESGSVARSVYALLRQQFYVDDFGVNTTPGTTDMTVALRAAVAAAAAAGGGTIHFSPGVTYLLSTESTHSVVVPIAGANYTDNTESYQYNVLLDGLDNIAFDLHGATIRNDTTTGGTMFLLDSCRNIWFRNGKIQSVHAHLANGTVTTTGTHAFSATSQDRDSFGLKFTNLQINSAYVGIYLFGTGAASPTYKIRNVDLDNVFFEHHMYALALHMNGFNVSGRYHARDILRDFFIYGVDDFDLRVTADVGPSGVGVGGFRPLIKAYTRDTKNGRIKYTTNKSITSGSHLGLEADYDTDTQAAPNKLLNIEVDIDNSAGNVLPAVDFAVYRDGALVNATTQVFHGIVLKGIHQNAPSISSTQNSGSLDTDGVVLLAGALNQIYDATGFFDPNQRSSTFTPVLRINSSTVGITYGTNEGQYWRDGRFIEALYNINLTSKGASVGNVTVELPVTSSAVAAVVGLPKVLGELNMAGLTGPIVGYVQSSGDLIILQQQGAAASAALTDANLTNTSRLRIQVRYPLW